MNKVKKFEISVVDRTYSKIVSNLVKFYSSDSALEVIFILAEEGYEFDSAELVLSNTDGSLITRPLTKVPEGYSYEFEENIISHHGEWKGQVVLYSGNNNYVSSKVVITIEDDLLSERPPTLTDVYSWTSLKRYADDLVDELKQAVLSIEDTFNANETARQNRSETAEQSRQATFETNESERYETFSTNETTRQSQEMEREEAEATRQNIFDSNETNRTEAFNINEATRQENESTRQRAETQRATAESVRVSNEEERILKDSERDSKIEVVESVIEDVSIKVDSKVNKYMLLSPKYDLVYDSCVRDVDAPLDAYSVPMESGHHFENVGDRDSDTILTYEPDGVLLASPTSRNDFSPILIAGFDVDSPYFDVRAKNLNVANDGRFWFIKYKDKDNWVAIRMRDVYQEIRVIASVEGIQTAIAVEETGGSVGEKQANSETIYSLKAEIIRVHRNFAESLRALRVFKNEQWLFTVPIPTNSVDFPNRVGFSVGSPTEILNFKAGRSS